MGQFDRFIERDVGTSSLGSRVFCVVLPVLWIVKAAESRHLNDILITVFMVVLMLPAGIAPKAHRARVAALDKHPVFSSVFMFLLMLCGFFVLFTQFLSRPTSIYLAAPAALALTTGGAVRRRGRARG